MLSTTAGAAPAPRKRRLAGLTREEERQQRRDNFALALLPVLRKLRRAGARTHAERAAGLNGRGIRSEHGRHWFPQTAAALHARLLALGANPPAVLVLPPAPQRSGRRRRYASAAYRQHNH